MGVGLKLKWRKPFDARCCHMSADIKYPMSDQVKSSFVIFDIRALLLSALSVTVTDVKNYK